MVDLLKIILRNVFRHRLRSGLTVLGVAIAMLAFSMLRTLVGAWYVGVNFASDNRLVTRNKTSLIYSLPIAYENKIRQVEGVTGVAFGSWYGGIYKEKKNFFAQYAISGLEYVDLYPEFIMSEEARTAFSKERNAAIAGKKLAARFNWKIGDVIPLEGTIYPGNMEFVLRGIYKGKRKGTDETAFFFRWDYFNEMLKKTMPERANKTGWYVVGVRDADQAAEIANTIDKMFANSLAETLTETEKAFQLGFVAMTDAIVAAIQIISVVVVGIILLVLANTMSMTARERTSEYSALKAIGFGNWFMFALIVGESMAIALTGGIVGVILSFPGADVFRKQLESFLPVFEPSLSTLALVLGVSMLVGLLASLPPAIRVSRIPIAEGLAHMG
jgi:putative ABC transport system permease protein